MMLEKHSDKLANMKVKEQDKVIKTWMAWPNWDVIEDGDNYNLLLLAWNMML